jgi:SAM-dependent methyltransferase
VEAGLNAPVIVGHSASGGYATAYAAQHASRGVVNIDSPLQIAPFIALLKSLGERVRGPEFPALWQQSACAKCCVTFDVAGASLCGRCSRTGSVGAAMTEPVAQHHATLMGIARGYQRSQALAVAAELGIADLVAAGSRSAAELAAATGTDAAALYRLLRALASIGVFHEDDGGSFGLTAMGDLLRRDHPQSIDPAVRMFCADYQWRAWRELGYSVRTGDTAAGHALGMDVWEHRRRNPQDGVVFDAAMRTMSASYARGIVEAYDFGRHRVIADIGGGTGTLLAAILRAHPAVRGILADQPQVLRDAPQVLAAAGVENRVRLVDCDFFAGVPRGADAYVLLRVLHDWGDDDALRVLGRVREAMEPTARLLVVDAVVGPPNEDPLTKFLDVMMLVSAGGRERTAGEWSALLDTAGFRLDAVVPAGPGRSVLDAVRDG